MNFEYSALSGFNSNAWSLDRRLYCSLRMISASLALASVRVYKFLRNHSFETGNQRIVTVLNYGGRTRVLTSFKFLVDGSLVFGLVNGVNLTETVNKGCC